jgi:hypothetical protein
MCAAQKLNASSLVSVARISVLFAKNDQTETISILILNKFQYRFRLLCCILKTCVFCYFITRKKKDKITMVVGNSSLISIILLAIGALVGALITFLIAGQRSENEPDDEQTTEPERKQSDIPAELKYDNFEEAARIWRNAEGRLAIEMNGVSFTNAKEMNPAAQGAADALVRECFAWLGKAAPPKTTPAASNVDDIALEKLNLSTPATAQIASRPLLKVEDDPDKVPDIPKESMIEQIDNILQSMLAGSELEDRSIHLVEGANMGVIVWVGNESFQGIDQVSDPVIAKVIQKAVAEWERRSTPNR